MYLTNLTSIGVIVGSADEHIVAIDRNRVAKRVTSRWCRVDESLKQAARHCVKRNLSTTLRHSPLQLLN